MSEPTTTANVGHKYVENEQELQDLGRADYVPKGEKKKYTKKFEDGDKVWMKTATADHPDLPSIVVYVKEARYTEETGKEGWVYKLQEKDDKGWYGPEKWKRENTLKRAG